MRSFDAPHSGVSPRGEPRNAVAGWRGAARARNRVGPQRLRYGVGCATFPRRETGTGHGGPTGVTATYLNGQEDETWDSDPAYKSGASCWSPPARWRSAWP